MEIPADSTLHSGTTQHEEALLLTRFYSLEQLESLVQIHYVKGIANRFNTAGSKSEVRLTYRAGDREVISSLQSGISEDDFLRAKQGYVWDQFMLGLRCPFAVVNRGKLKCIESLGRRRPWEFGKGDVAFYDLAETMVKNIRDEDRIHMSADDLSDKGYLNTFNHVTAQALMTSLFSESIADFVADVHERHNLPEMITGNFTDHQLHDLKDGPVDNYIDMINNEWGQELGKVLAAKYSINRDTHWTPELLANYLNDNQSYYSWVFRVGFKPFQPTDELVMRFEKKLNIVLAYR
jgi:hypothetical protein